jgi:hypothetical protein
LTGSRVGFQNYALEAYMVVNFRARGISRGARKLARTLTLIKKKYALKVLQEINIT